MDDTKLNEIIEAVVRQLIAVGAVPGEHPVPSSPMSNETEKLPDSKISSKPTDKVSGTIPTKTNIDIDLPDPTNKEFRYKSRISNPKDPAAITELIASTTARIGVGRAGPRNKTASLLLFQADHAITQDALYRDVDPKLLTEFGLFTVQTRVTGGKEEYLLRPDLGRLLSDDARQKLAETCIKNPNIQLVIGDGLSAAAIEANLRQIYLRYTLPR